MDWIMASDGSRCRAILFLPWYSGKAQYTAVSYKSVVSFTCNYGYMLVGDGTRYSK